MPNEITIVHVGALAHLNSPEPLLQQQYVEQMLRIWCDGETEREALDDDGAGDEREGADTDIM